jgi:RNA polymerase sigma-70 factor (ECF subfamily)
MGKKSLATSEMSDVPSDFESMYETNQPHVYRFMFWRTKDVMLAEDLTSRVFEKAWRTRRSFTGGSAKAWLFRIARTTLIDYWRKAKDFAAEDTVIAQLESPATPMSEEIDQQLLVEDLQAAVSKLPDEMRQVVALRFIEGKTARQTGRLLGLSEANVRVIQYRALQKLRKYML